MSERRWTSPTGETIACTDAVLMGCDEAQFRAAVLDVVAAIRSAYASLDEVSKGSKEG